MNKLLFYVVFAMLSFNVFGQVQIMDFGLDFDFNKTIDEFKLEYPYMVPEKQENKYYDVLLDDNSNDICLLKYNFDKETKLLASIHAIIQPPHSYGNILLYYNLLKKDENNDLDEYVEEDGMWTVINNTPTIINGYSVFLVLTYYYYNNMGAILFIVKRE
jgi:hypothetical protein